MKKKTHLTNVLAGLFIVFVVAMVVLGVWSWFTR